MLSLSDVIVANEQQVAAKVMEGEAILINLTTGAYYSIPSTGGFIWSLVERRLPLDAIVGAVCEHYDVSRTQAEADVLQLAEQLQTEGLVTVGDPSSAVGTAPEAAGTALPYQKPTFEKFTDMAEMFALDPPLPGLANQQRSQT